MNCMSLAPKTIQYVQPGPSHLRLELRRVVFDWYSYAHRRSFTPAQLCFAFKQPLRNPRTCALGYCRRISRVEAFDRVYILRQAKNMNRLNPLPKTLLAMELSLASIPTVSREFAYATTPHRDTMPYEGLKPVIPVYAAGSRIDPPVSVPNALFT